MDCRKQLKCSFGLFLLFTGNKINEGSIGTMTDLSSISRLVRRIESPFNAGPYDPRKG
jgi:hypothetical protein